MRMLIKELKDLEDGDLVVGVIQLESMGEPVLVYPIARRVISHFEDEFQWPKRRVRWWVGSSSLREARSEPMDMSTEFLVVRP